MKKASIILAAIVLSVLTFSSCEPIVHTDYAISWGIFDYEIHDMNYSPEMNLIYTNFDETFSNASFGPVSNHTVIARSLTPKEIEKVKAEAISLANEANEKISEMLSTNNFYEITVSGSNGEENEKLVSFTYGEKE